MLAGGIGKLGKLLGHESVTLISTCLIIIGPENAGPQKQDGKMEDKLPKAIT